MFSITPLFKFLLTALSGTLYVNNYSFFDPGQQPCSQPESSLRTSYDFVIVGSGPSGSVIANRLSSNPCVNVLLIETGGIAQGTARVPLLSDFMSSVNSPIRTGYKTTNQTTVSQENLPHMISSLLFSKNPIKEIIVFAYLYNCTEGSSESNDMAYLRGASADFNAWAAGGATNWDYNAVLPMFKKSENNAIPGLTPSIYHAVGGPVTISESPYVSLLRSALTAALTSLGLSPVDVNGATQAGYTVIPLAISKGVRVSASSAYLTPAKTRPNLHIITGATVNKILFNKGYNRANGVTYFRNGIPETVRVSKELILSSGSVGTTQMLLLSGIGPTTHLNAMNVTVVKDLPVGNNLRDPVSVTLKFTLKETFGLSASLFGGMIDQYSSNFTGLLSSTGSELVAYINSTSTSPTNVMFTISNEGPGLLENFVIYSIKVTPMRPKTKGRIRLASSDPFVGPIINPQYLADPADAAVLSSGILAAFQLSETPSMQALGSTFYYKGYPLCENTGNVTDYINCLILKYGEGTGDLVGTCKMGAVKDSTAVVSPNLFVKGIRNLRVADRSIMPDPISGNVWTNTMMIGEKAADMIAADWNIKLS